MPLFMGGVPCVLIPDPICPTPVSYPVGGGIRPPLPTVPLVMSSDPPIRNYPSVGQFNPWGARSSPSMWVDSIRPLAVGLDPPPGVSRSVLTPTATMAAGPAAPCRLCTGPCCWFPPPSPLHGLFYQPPAAVLLASFSPCWFRHRFLSAAAAPRWCRLCRLLAALCSLVSGLIEH